LDNAYEGGNKILAVTNHMQAYGMPRDKMSRLTGTAEEGDEHFFVEPGLDWGPGDRLALLATGFANDEADEVFIVSYDSETGEVEADRELEYDHYGRDESTADLYNGLDIRGEVLMLTRNVKIQGNHAVIPQFVTDEEMLWGGQLVIGWMIEQDFTMRYGSLEMDNVELFQLSQADTPKAAIRFEKVPLSSSSVTNCAIHNGWGWGISIEESQNVVIRGNTLFNFRPIGIAVQTSNLITID
jgi:parallel beta-helix repeat protein